MAMDVHLPPVDQHSAEHAAYDHMQNDVDQTMCADAGGHCSHHQAHSAGLLSVNTLLDVHAQAVLLPVIKNSEFLQSQAPPVRPPKA